MLLDFIKSYQMSFEIALKALLRNKVRAILTILGITVGIMAVIIVLSAGRAIQDFITNQITMFGTDYIVVEIKVPSTEHVSVENASAISQGVTITTLKESDADEIKKLSNIKDIYSGQMGQEVFSYQEKNKVGMLFGVTASFSNVDPGELEEGRFFTDSEDKSLTKIVVLGSRLKKNIFGNDDAIGKRVKIGKQNYKVIGVMKERGSAGVFSMDDIAFVPLRTLQKLILGINYVQLIYVKTTNSALADVTADDIIVLIRSLHKIDDPKNDDFSVTTSSQGMAILGTVIGAIKLLLFAIASISLVVGGIGIMNVMYVSVAERTFEIGLRKAMGAKRSNILRQFWAEAIMITTLGGLAGIILGTAFSFFISRLANSFGFNWKFYISLNYIVLAVGISVLVGLISGVYPARAAAKLDPIVALRKE
jgi:putative ABC transport system permease protein